MTEPFGDVGGRFSVICLTTGDCLIIKLTKIILNKKGCIKQKH